MTKFIRTGGGIGGEKNIYIYKTQLSSRNTINFSLYAVFHFLQ